MELLATRHRFVPLGRAEGFDLATPNRKTWESPLGDVDAIVHFAARADVDGCEKERALATKGNAWIVNVEATKTLGEIAADAGAYFLHISTDYVFPAAANGPFGEDAPVATTASQTNWYGWTKREAERALRGFAKEYAVLRIAHPYRAHFPRRLDHARRMIDAVDRGEMFAAFDDQRLTPVFTDDVAEAVAALLAKRATGLYHCASTDVVTPFDFGRRLLAATGRDASKLSRGSFDEFRRANPTPRPKNGGLAMKTSREAGIPARSTADGITRFAAQLPSKGPGRTTPG